MTTAGSRLRRRGAVERGRDAVPASTRRSLERLADKLDEAQSVLDRASRQACRPPDEGLSEPRYRIVVLCTGNRFRSVVAEAVLRRATRALPVSVESAGTSGTDDLPPLREARRFAKSRGLEVERHRSRRLTRLDPRETDLLLGFERAHMAFAVVELGIPSDRVFTLPELAALLDRVDPPADVPVHERARIVVEMAHALRASGELGDRVLEVKDPVRLAPRRVERLGPEIEALCTRVARGLFGEPAGS